jgi:peptidoglycan-associated lipoprotein
MPMARLLICLAAFSGAAFAQPRPAVPAPAPIELLRSDFAARSGGSTIYFGTGSAQIGAPAAAVLAAQAMWILQHPEISVRIEGSADPGDTRDHALAMGARRANEVRNYLILLGVPAGQVTAMSWGKEHPGSGRVFTNLVVPGAP